ncbi:MAG: hypothetical protein WCH46_04620 [bacterium]
MKPHLLMAADDSGSAKSDEPVQRLASRYNIPEKDVAALLYGSGAPKVATEGSSIKGNTMADDFRAGYGAPQMRDRGWTPMTVLSLVVGILGIMALAVLLVAILRHDGSNEREMMMRHHMMGMMPPPMMRPPHGNDTAMGMRPPHSGNPAAVENEPAPSAQNEVDGPAPKVTKKHSARSTSGFTTSNNLEAEEHLAELRSEGNTKARIHESTKNGVTIYSVH